MTEVHQPEADSDGLWVVAWSGYGKPHFDSYLRTFGTFQSPEEALTAAFMRLQSDQTFADAVRSRSKSKMGGRFYAVNTGMYVQVDPPAKAAEGGG